MGWRRPYSIGMLTHSTAGGWKPTHKTGAGRQTPASIRAFGPRHGEPKRHGERKLNTYGAGGSRAAALGRKTAPFSAPGEVSPSPPRTLSSAPYWRHSTLADWRT